MRIPTAAGAAFALLVGPGVLVGQERELEIRPAKELGEPFTRIVSVSEFPDGRLLVVDQREHTVSIVDFDTDNRADIGREGRGPREFLTPFAIVRLPGDTLGVYDSGNRRLLLVGPQGSLAGELSIPAELYIGGISQPKGADRWGRLYFARSRPFTGVDDIPRRSSIVRVDPVDGSIDSVQQVLNRDSLGRKMLRSFAAYDGWDVTRDGSLAIVRGGDFHVEWWTGAETVRGSTLSHTRAPVTRAEIAAYLASEESRRGGSVRMGAGRSDISSSGVRRLRENWEFPETLPGFDPERVFIDPDDRLLVQLKQAWNSPRAVIAVFTAGQDLVARLVTGEAVSLVGVGRDAVYAVRTDEDGLQWLRKYVVPEG